MRRTPALLATAAVLAVLPASSAAAAPPEEFDVSIDYPAGVVCAFPLSLDASGKTKVIDRGDSTIVTGPRNVFTLTNDATGASTTQRLGGIFKDRSLGGGLTATVSTGRNLVLTSNAGAVLLVGRYEFTLDADGALVGRYEGKGQLVDLCARLS